MGGGSPRRRMAVPMFLRESTTISPMHVIFAHIVPLFAGWRRCWLYACTLQNGLRHFGFLQTIPTTLEWQDCMLKICNNRNTGRTFKLCATNFISWILQWQPEECNNFFQWHEIEKLKKQKNKYKEPWKRIKMIACSCCELLTAWYITLASQSLKEPLSSCPWIYFRIFEDNGRTQRIFFCSFWLLNSSGWCEEAVWRAKTGWQAWPTALICNCRLKMLTVECGNFIHIDTCWYSLVLS